MSNGALRKGDTLLGNAEEHSGHYIKDEGEDTESTSDDTYYPEHNNITVTGNVSSGSHNVYINGKHAARLNDITDEYDVCDGSNHGRISSGSSKVLINGIPAANQNDNLEQHSGNGKFTSSSNNVFINK